MKLKEFIKRLFIKASVLFTLITAIYALIVMFMNVDDDRILLDAERILLFFVFSLLLALANLLYSRLRFHVLARILIHYGITIFGVYTCFLLPIEQAPSTTFTGLGLFTALYAVIFALIAFFSARHRTLTEKNEEYKSQFSTEK